MKIHYFFIHERMDHFYKLKLIALLEEKETSRANVERLKFTFLEKLKIFISKDDNYHTVDISHEFAEDSCSEHFAHSRKELFEAMNKRELKPINRIQYERFRKVALAIYNKQRLVDFSKYKGRQTYTIKTIIGD